ncbi:MAG: proline--tRNA ligase [Actinobacteria bacterium]|nr:proline--tRNA ligase [Actinomycetota bacterium]
MRFSKLFIPTLKEEPAEAEIISHKLLFRAGMVRKVASGVYSFLPLGFKVLKKIERIIREEMDAIGAQEILMPALQPSEIWVESGRWSEYGPEMWRVKDRNDRDFCLGPTHEELVTSLVMGEVRSYRQLPQTFYQIQMKFRDEIRPRFGLMRAREFLMKDAYSFNADLEDLERSYTDMDRAYTRIFQRCGFNFRSVEAASGLIGGKVSREFMILAESGEDTVFYCDSCDYAASADVATTRLIEPPKEAARPTIKVSTPGKKSVTEVSAFLGVPQEKLVKTLVYRFEDSIAAVLMRGGREVNESKLSAILGTTRFHLLGEGEFREVDLVPGYVGPVGLREGVRLIADDEVALLTNFVVGANEEDAHLKDVNIGVDFQVEEWGDLKLAEEGEPCPQCAGGKLLSAKSIEAGHIFQLGTRYSEAMGASFVAENGERKPYIMGCYGIGVSRMVAAAIEQYHDDAGILWPVSIAPFEIEIVPLKWDDGAIRKTAEELYEGLLAKGIEALLDDRSESPGKKFADADLIGIPVQIIIGPRSIVSGNAEIKVRSTAERSEAPIADAVDESVRILKNLFRAIAGE